MSESKSRASSSADAGLLRWLSDLSEAYNARLMWTLVAAQFVLKGFVMGYSVGGFDWLLAARNVPGPMMQIYSSIGMLPFAMKPLIGMLSDAFPIFGYQKNPYIALTTFIGLCGLLTIAASGYMAIGVKWLVIGLFCIIMMISSADVLTEAKYAERVRSAPEKGPDLITFVWLLVTSGGLIATLTLGLLLEHYAPHCVYIVCLVPASIMLAPTLFNWLDERRLAPSEVASVREHYFDQWELVVLVVLVGFSSIIIMVTGLVQHNIWVNLAVGLACGAIIVAGFMLLTAPIIGRMVTFAMIQHFFAFSTLGAVFYFYTDGPEEYPEGPHFTPLFYITIIGVVGSLCSMLGFTLFNLFMKHWRYHSVFLATNLVYCLGHSLSAVQFSRLNLSWGVSDTIFAVSYAMITSVTGSMLFLPSIVLLTQLCPKNVEATMYALLAGASNLGTQIGGLIGAAVLHSLDITPRGEKGESDKFENLWIAALISSLSPIVTLLLLPWMIPNALQTERLMDENAKASDGSPWRRYWQERGLSEASKDGVSYGATEM